MYDIISADEVCRSAGKAVCVGRNFIAHARELSNPVPDVPVLFTKTPNCFVPLCPSIKLPSVGGPCHHELELVLIVGHPLTAEGYVPGAGMQAMRAVALGLDLTLREVQSELKAQSLPWTRAKCFDGAAPVTDAIRLPLLQSASALADFHMQLNVNGEQRQIGHLSDLIFDVERLIAETVQFMSLAPGDLIFTGTPAGVGPLVSGDVLSLKLWTGDRASDSAVAQLLIDAESRVL